MSRKELALAKKMSSLDTTGMRVSGGGKPPAQITRCLPYGTAKVVPNMRSRRMIMNSVSSGALLPMCRLMLIGAAS